MASSRTQEPQAHHSGLSLLEAALAKLLSQEPQAASFNFVVLGDSRWWEPIIQPDTFREIVREADLLRPAFIVHLGDYVHGYTFDLEMLNRQWDEFEKVIRSARAPLFPLVGNHEVTAPSHEEVFKQRVGRLYYSFDFANSHFICLDSEEVGFGSIGPEQMEWLSTDLRNTHAQHVFIFVHQPLWHDPAVWDPVHRLLACHNVRAVFSGHRHGFEAFPARDGIRYFTCAGAGSGFTRAPEEGGFHHFLWVSVRGNEIHYALLKPGNIFPVDLLASPQADFRERLETQFDPREIDSLAQAFAQIVLSPHDPVAAAAQLARDSQGNLRHVALALIARFADSDLAPAVAYLLDDADEELADVALAALMTADHPAAEPLARTILTSKDATLVRRAVRLLASEARVNFPRRLRRALPDPQRAALLAEQAVSDLVGVLKVHVLARVADALLEAFPESECAAPMLRVRLHKAAAFLAAERFADAIVVADEVLSIAATGAFADTAVPEALLLKAKALTALARPNEAVALCHQLRSNFPSHSLAPEAAQLAQRLGQ